MNSSFVLQASSEGPVYAQFADTKAAPTANSSTLEHRGFSPYDFNGGTVAAIAGPDYCVVACDTRLSSGYEILSRDVSKIHSFGSGVLASSGSKNDVDQLRSWMDIKLKIYEHNHQKPMSLDSIAQLLSTTLYHKRFFPYYTFNLLGGIDSDGKGAVFSYDAIGSFEKTAYSASGSGQAYVIPLLDNCIGLRNRLNTAEPIPAEEVVELLKDAFLSAGERDIYTGDEVEFHVIKAGQGTTVERFSLKAD